MSLNSNPVKSGLTSLSILKKSGVVRPMSPSSLRKIVRTVKTWGTGPAGGFIQLALTKPDQVGIIDERREVTFGQLHERSNAIANGLAGRGVREGDQVAIMCRNHAGFIEASIAVAKLGADILYLNTAFAGPQLVAVLDREAPGLVIHDEEFTGLLAGAAVEQRVLAWTDGEPPAESLDALAAAYPSTDLQPPSRHTKVVILTSGTTGTPKGAPRKEAGISNGVSLMSRLPLETGWRTHIAAPLFHTWGLAHMFMSMLLGATIVLRRKFDPEETLRSLQDDRCDSFIVIPIMLQRILGLPEEIRSKYSLPNLKVVAASGSALPGHLATEWMDAFGDNLYNIYGSTEVAYASIAMPDDLRAAPESAGKPPHETVVKILDAEGKEVPQGHSGRIFVANKMLFEGYTGGGNKEIIDGLMSTGDVGRFDENGRLYVEGRDDEMIVSGGENVFPREVEDCIAQHPAVVEVACVGVEDEEFGQRLRAFVVVNDPAAGTPQFIQDWVRSNLARYKVPRDVLFVDELPRNATGKILKRELVRS